MEYNSYSEGYRSDVVSVKEWVLTMLVMSIPIVNIVMVFVWAFSSETKMSKSNYFKASLIIAAISIGFTMLLLMILVPINIISIS